MGNFFGLPAGGYSNTSPQGPVQVPGFGERLGNAFNSPAMQLAAGLLTGAAPGGSLGGGLSQGLLNMQKSSLAQNRAEIQQAQLDAYNRKIESDAAQEDRMNKFRTETMPGLIGTPSAIAPMIPGSEQEFQNFESPLSAPGVEGGLLMTPGTGIAANNPQLAGLLNAYAEVDPSAAMGAAFNAATAAPATTPAPFSSIGKLQEDLSSGRINEQQYNTALDAMGKSGVNLSVSTGNDLRNVSDQYRLDQYNQIGDQMLKANSDYAQNIGRANSGIDLLKTMQQTGNPSGKWADIKTSAASWLGVDPEMVSTMEQFGIQAGRDVMNTIQQTKGSVSEREMSYFDKINQGTTKTMFTNYVLLKGKQIALQRAKDQARYWPEYIDQGKPPGQFYDWYLKEHGLKNYPELTQGRLKKMFKEEIGDIGDGTEGWSIKRSD